MNDALAILIIPAIGLTATAWIRSILVNPPTIYGWSNSAFMCSVTVIQVIWLVRLWF